MFRLLESLFWTCVLVGAYLLTLVDWCPQIPLLFEIILSFKFELIGAATILFFIALLRRRVLVSALLLIPIVVQTTEVVTAFMPNDLSRIENEFVHKGSTLKVLMANLHYGNEDVESFRKLIETEKPDVIFVLEIVGPWLEEMERMRDQYPFYVPEKSHEGLQVRVLSKIPLILPEMIGLSDPLRPVLAARVMLDGHELRIIAAHLSAPQFQERFDLRNEQLMRLADMIYAEKLPTVVLGDLNITRWSPYFKLFMQKAQLVDSRLGRGLMASWRPFGDTFPIFKAPIDQILYTPDLRLGQVRLGANINSDHLPMIAEVKQRYATDQNFYQQLRNTSDAR